MKPILAWHCLQDGRIKTWYTPARRKRPHCGKKVKVGDVLTVRPPVRCCENGLHASRRLSNAWRFVVHSQWVTVCHVELSGHVDEGLRKLCASTRKVIGLVDDGNRVLARVVCRVLRKRWPKTSKTPTGREALRRISYSLQRGRSFPTCYDMSKRITSLLQRYLYVSVRDIVGLPEFAKPLEAALLRAMKKGGR